MEHLQKWLGFSLLYLKTKHKTLHVKRAWAELGISTICMTFDRSSLILDRSSQTELHNKFCSNSIPTLHKKQILWASLNKTKTFWSWFANITNWSSNSFKPKVLEPNRCYGFFFFLYEIWLHWFRNWWSNLFLYSICLNMCIWNNECKSKFEMLRWIKNLFLPNGFWSYGFFFFFFFVFLYFLCFWLRDT